MLERVDTYAREVKKPSSVGGTITVVATGLALAYAGWLVAGYLQQPPSMASNVQWADTNGPWPMQIQCVAAGGCYVSNTHNKFSSHGDLVQAAQQSCFYLRQGQQYTINFTFTQDPHAGLILAWNSQDNSSSVPGSGVTVRADTNCPSCPDGVYSLWTPALGGTYLANLIETTNGTSTVAPFRREWFLTYVSDGFGLQSWAPCWSNISAADRSKYSQASIRIMSAWYSVTIQKHQEWLQLLGTIGGAVGVCLSAGGVLLAVLEAIYKWLQRCRKGSAVKVQPEDDEPSQGAHEQEQEQQAPEPPPSNRKSKAGAMKKKKLGNHRAASPPRPASPPSSSSGEDEVQQISSGKPRASPHIVAEAWGDE